MLQQNPAPHLRLFIAIQLPEAIKAALEQAQIELRSAVPTKAIRWTLPKQFHLTLRFLGNVDVQRVEALTQGLRCACEAFPALQMRAAGIGFFPSERVPRVLWAGLEDAAGRLAPLQEAVNVASAGFILGQDGGQFAGHITLARIKGLRRPEAERLVEAARRMDNRQFGQWAARDVELVRSVLSSGGSVYTTMAACPLLGPA